jgi:hypothetical protein
MLVMRTTRILFILVFSILQIHAQYNLKEEVYPSHIKTVKSTYYFNDSLSQEKTIYFNRKGQKNLVEYFLLALNSYGTWMRNVTGWKKFYYNDFDSIQCAVSYNRPIMFSMLVTEKDSSIYTYDRNHFLSSVITHHIRPTMNQTTPTKEYYFPPNDSMEVVGNDRYTKIYDTTFKTITTKSDTMIYSYHCHSNYRDGLHTYWRVNGRLMKETLYQEDVFNQPLVLKKTILYAYSPDSGYIKLQITNPEKGRKFTYYTEEKYTKNDRIEYINEYREDENKDERKNLSEFLYEFNPDKTVASITVTVVNYTGYYYHKKTRFYYTYYED